MEPASESGDLQLFFRVCLRCHRAVPGDSLEYYCTNDGTKLLESCPKCGSRINSPYARFCASCGCAFTTANQNDQRS